MNMSARFQKYIDTEGKYASLNSYISINDSTIKITISFYAHNHEKTYTFSQPISNFETKGDKAVLEWHNNCILDVLKLR